MKKRHIAMLSLGALMACTLGLGVFTACDEGGGDAVKPSEYLDGINYYYGDGNDVHLQGWFVSENNDAWKVEEGVSDGGSTVTKLGFNKNMANNSFSVQIDGEYSDFKYLNITMRAEARGSDRAIAAHLSVANPIPQKDHLNVLGSDLYFDVSADVYTTYTFLVPSVSRQTLDVADYVRLAPDPGIQNTGTTLYTGDIYVKDCWFSKEAPADGVTPVDDTWRTEAWCGYTVTRGGADSEATISYEHPADWSRFYRPVPLEEVFLEDGTVNNMLRIRFTSDTVGEGETALRDSVEQFQVGLWGDPDPTSDAQFWQSWFGQYSSYGFSNGTHSSADTMTVEKDEETGVITLTCQAAPALIGLAGNFNEQLWICFNLESQPQGGEPGGAPGYIAENTPFDGIGQMTILSSEFYYDETMPEYREPVVNESGWSQNGVGAYVISSEKAGVMANVTFDNISPNAWSCLAYDGNGGDKTVAVLTLRNNGTEKVLYGIDWSNEAGRKYGFIEPGATVEVRAENTSASGPINFFLDSCYDANDPSRLPDKEEYSGDVDIVSLTYEEGEPPEEPGDPDPVDVAWGVVDSGKSLYTITGGEEIDANVQYSGVSSGLWANLYRDVSADECRPNVKLTLRNNGEEKVLYGAELGAEETRKYGWIEPGQTVTVELNNENVYTVINLFLDCCYQGDYTTDKETLSGNVDIVSVEFSGEFAPDSEPSALNWTTTAANLSVKDGVVTLNNLMDGAWQNVSADLTLDAGGKITIPVTNNTNAIAKFKLSVMCNNDQGSWSDLEGNGTTVCWLEIPKGETWNMELTVSALDAPKVAHIMLMVACWDKDGTQADGTTPRPEPPYTGTVTIGEMKFTPDATQPPVSEGTVVNVTWGTDAANLSVSEKTVTLNNLPIAAWQNVNADLTLSEACKVTLSITNNTGDVAKFKLQLMDAAWKQIGGDGDPCVCWMEIASGETMELTLTVTAEQAARVAHIMLMVNCWVSGDVVTETGAPCPAGPYTGNIVLGDVKVS